MRTCQVPAMPTATTWGYQAGKAGEGSAPPQPKAGGAGLGERLPRQGEPLSPSPPQAGDGAAAAARRQERGPDPGQVGAAEGGGPQSSTPATPPPLTHKSLDICAREQGSPHPPHR